MSRGWRINRYTMSLLPYTRLRTRDGGRVSNHALDECHDPAVWAAVALYEHEQERAAAHRARLREES